MATVPATVAHVSELASDRGALVEEKAGGGESSAAAVRIQSECALTLKNAGFRRNLTEESIPDIATETRGGSLDE